MDCHKNYYSIIVGCKHSAFHLTYRAKFQEYFCDKTQHKNPDHCLRYLGVANSKFETVRRGD